MNYSILIILLYSVHVTPLGHTSTPLNPLQRGMSPDQGSVGSSLSYCNYIHMNPSCYKTISRINTKQNLTRLRIIKDSMCISVMIYNFTLARTPLTPRPTVSPNSGKPCLHQLRILLANSSSSTTPAQ